jgi:type II secretory ATPase GspE/PulE/Tfp pilus assembly ATPase PilB-like protein
VRGFVNLVFGNKDRGVLQGPGSLMVPIMSLIGKEIGELLVDSGLLTLAQLEIAEREKLKTRETMSRVLARLGFATENQIKDTLELQFGVTYASLAKLNPRAEVINLLPEKLIRQYQLLPVDYQDGRLTLAMVNPDDPLAAIDVKNYIEVQQLKTVVCMEDDFDQFVEAFFIPEDDEPAEVEEIAQVDTDQSGGTANSAQDLSEMLVGEGLIDDDQLFAALKVGLKEKKDLSEVVVQMNLITPDQLQKLLAKRKENASSSIGPTKTQPLAEKPTLGNGKGAHMMVPGSNLDGASKAAPATSVAPSQKNADGKSSSKVLENAGPRVQGEAAAANSVFTRMQKSAEDSHFDLNVVFAPKVSLHDIDSSNAIARYNNLEDDIDFLELVKQAQDASISLVANHITLSAVESRCSDIHIHSTAADLVVQYFAQGNLVNESRLEKGLMAELIACYKDMAGLDRSETERPQDKRVTMKIADCDIEVRITTIPEDGQEMVAITIKYLD